MNTNSPHSTVDRTNDVNVQRTISKLTSSSPSRIDLAAMHYNRQLSEVKSIITYMQAFASAEVVYQDILNLIDEIC